MSEAPASHVAPDMRAAITQRLTEVEARHGVRVLYAIESGSRAWGFPSPDSDYDVRFIYAHPRDWYLSVNEARDVIEEGVDEMDFDVAGWDLRKALRLFLKATGSCLTGSRGQPPRAIRRRFQGSHITMLVGTNRQATCWCFQQALEKAVGGAKVEDGHGPGLAVDAVRFDDTPIGMSTDHVLLQARHGFVYTSDTRGLSRATRVPYASILAKVGDATERKEKSGFVYTKTEGRGTTTKPRGMGLPST